jgi:hypothetical protein
MLDHLESRRAPVGDERENHRHDLDQQPHAVRAILSVGPAAELRPA